MTTFLLLPRLPSQRDALYARTPMVLIPIRDIVGVGDRDEGTGAMIWLSSSVGAAQVNVTAVEVAALIASAIADNGDGYEIVTYRAGEKP